jgi:hypothetical protein
LRNTIGEQFFDILRFILLSNRCHLIHLTGSLQISECANQTEQFLCVVATPERELIFQKKKEASGNVWFGHGSILSRWHSILHTGLQDLGRTADALNGGPWYGDGVYQSNASETSFAYAGGGRIHEVNANKCKNTELPVNMTVLALCENVKGPNLNLVYPLEYTQKDPEGLIVRCMMVAKESFSWDPYAKPPRYVRRSRTASPILLREEEMESEEELRQWNSSNSLCYRDECMESEGNKYLNCGIQKTYYCIKGNRWNLKSANIETAELK